MPQKTLSRLAGMLANSRIPWLKNYLIRYFINRYPVTMEEAIESNPFAYPSYNAFFTRLLKPELRPIASGLYDFASPVDGCISQIAHIEAERLIQAKGRYFSAAELLADAELAKPFRDGSFTTLYLAPHNYHRIHMPMDGRLTKMIYVPGRLFSVNTKTAGSIPNLFARNGRLVTFFDTSAGRMCVVLVGAMIVGSIETAWAGPVNPAHTNDLRTWTYHHPIHLRRGEELGLFKLGSTVIVLLEKDAITWKPTLCQGTVIKYGECLGTFKLLRV